MLADGQILIPIRAEGGVQYPIRADPITYDGRQCRVTFEWIEDQSALLLTRRDEVRSDVLITSPGYFPKLLAADSWNSLKPLATVRLEPSLSHPVKLKIWLAGSGDELAQRALNEVAYLNDAFYANSVGLAFKADIEVVSATPGEYIAVSCADVPKIDPRFVDKSAINVYYPNVGNTTQACPLGLGSNEWYSIFMGSTAPIDALAHEVTHILGLWSELERVRACKPEEERCLANLQFQNATSPRKYLFPEQIYWIFFSTRSAVRLLDHNFAADTYKGALSDCCADPVDGRYECPWIGYRPGYNPCNPPGRQQPPTPD
jgi:hypothetical protein